MSGELLTIKDTAARLRVSPITLCRWIVTRGLPCHGVSRRSRFCDWDEVQAWIRGQGATAAPAEPLQFPRRGVMIDLPRRG